VGGTSATLSFRYEEGAHGQPSLSGTVQRGDVCNPPLYSARPRNGDLTVYKLIITAVDIRGHHHNDCNQSSNSGQFPDNYWRTVVRKPYFPSPELHFREPARNFRHGSSQRQGGNPVCIFLPMSFPFMKSSVAWQSRKPVIILWEHIPAPGKEIKSMGR